jgi:hypothetical protein
MAAMPFIQELAESLDGRIRELNHEIAALQDARTALTSNGRVSTRVRSPRGDARPRRVVRGKAARTSRSLPPNKAEQLLADGDGMTTAALAKEAGADRDQVLALLRNLEKARRVRRTEQRRATRWHAITDEDRISHRAAEPTTRRRRRPTRSTVAPGS